jgi:hypothetical protein
MSNTFVMHVSEIMSDGEYREMLAFENWAQHRSNFLYPDAFEKVVSWDRQEVGYRDAGLQELFDAFRAGDDKDLWMPSVGTEAVAAGSVVIGPQIIVREGPPVDAEMEIPDFEEIAARLEDQPKRNATRSLHRHIALGAPHNLLIQVNDPVSFGGASYSYEIVLPDGTPFPIEFQYQEPEKGVVGITMESLLAICIDRLEAFQRGPYPCRENALALTKIEEALLWLHRRTERLSYEDAGAEDHDDD